MNDLDIDTILNRNHIINQIKVLLKKFENNHKDLSIKRGIYIYGQTGVGKTTFINKLLKKLDYDIISYDAGDIRNKSVIETIDNTNMSNRNIMSLFHKKKQPLAIIMDEIDGINTGDKGGINALIKLIRPKKTKKQQLEEKTANPIICIGNCHSDKKIKELISVCDVIEIPTPTDEQITSIIMHLLSNISIELMDKILKYVQGDLRKINVIYQMYMKNSAMLENVLSNNVFVIKSYSDDIRNITRKLLIKYHNIDQHNVIMNNTDRTSIGLLWHENIIDLLEKKPRESGIICYNKILENICIADYIDRIRFQNQIWQFNEMSSLIKTFASCKIYHDTFTNIPQNIDTIESQGTDIEPQNINAELEDTQSSTNISNIEDICIRNTDIQQPDDNLSYEPIRFTKILTKFATEFNNMFFVYLILCQKMGVDKQTMCKFLLNLKKTESMDKIYQFMSEKYEIKKLEVNRIYRYLMKYTSDGNTSIDSELDDDLINSDEMFDYIG